MLQRLILAIILGILLAPFSAQAGSNCLPQSLFPKDIDASPPRFDLGLVANAPTLCAYNGNAELVGCWAVDPANATLLATTATSLPGHGQKVKLDANKCTDGYCVGYEAQSPEPDQDRQVLLAASTDGASLVILSERILYVFDRVTKRQLKTIPLSDESALSNTNVSNEPINLFYAGNTIYVVGSDAGPYIGVWRFKGDGQRLGIITSSGKADGSAFSIYNGGINLLDNDHIALADAGLLTLLVISEKDGKRRELERRVNWSPCTKKEIENVNLGDLEGLKARCRKTVATRFEPYFDFVPIQLPSGDFIAALADNYRGSLAILDGKTLNEKKRLMVPRCP